MPRTRSTQPPPCLGCALCDPAIAAAEADRDAELDAELALIEAAEAAEADLIASGDIRSPLRPRIADRDVWA